MIEFKLPQYLRKKYIQKYGGHMVLFLMLVFVAVASFVSFLHFYKLNLILAYSDAESHINFSKRVVSGISPGFSQLGGVWLPLQHVMMIPFVINDSMWRSGVGGSILSMICFIVSAVYIYRISNMFVRSSISAIISVFVFVANPNILYLQATPLGELSLIVTFVMGVFYILRWVKTDNSSDLMKSALLIAAGSLIRYDAWFFIGVTFVVLPIIQFSKKYKLHKIEGVGFLYWSLAITGVIFWLVWNQLIFQNPLYFLASKYSPRTQQLAWMAQGQLPSYKNLSNSIIFYSVAAIKNSGLYLSVISVISFIYLGVKVLRKQESVQEFLVIILLTTPYFFYIITLYFGISVIFIPELLPPTYKYTLFNVRYGIMVLPVISVLVGYLYSRLNSAFRIVLIFIILFQIFNFTSERHSIVLEDGISGTSSRHPTSVNKFIADHYDFGYVMFDDYSRPVNPVNLNIPMNKIVYIGNHPLWDQALKDPTNKVRWLVIRKDENDSLWQSYKNNEHFLANYKQLYSTDNVYVFKQIKS
jgi:hypothetical protein